MNKYKRNFLLVLLFLIFFNDFGFGTESRLIQEETKRQKFEQGNVIQATETFTEKYFNFSHHDGKLKENTKVREVKIVKGLLLEVRYIDSEGDIAVNALSDEFQWPRDVWIRKKNCVKMEKIPECSICYHHFPVQLQLPCKHSLCTLCLQNIFLTNGLKETCPLCREPLPQNIHKYKPNIYTIPQDTPRDILQISMPFICSLGNINVMQNWIQEFRLDVNKKGFLNHVPLFVSKTKEMVEILFQNGVNLNERTVSEGKNLLHISTLNKKFDLVQYLVEEKNMNFDEPTNDGLTPLFFSCYNENFKLLKYFIEKGASIHPKLNAKCSPLYISCFNGNFGIMKFLIKHGAKVNAAISFNNITPIWIASKKGYLKLVKFLIKNGAEINITTKTGSTPLAEALINQHFEVAKFLLSKGSEIEKTKEYLDNEICFEAIDKLMELCE